MWTESAAAAFLPLLPEGHELPELDLERLGAICDDPAARLLLAEEDGTVLGYSAFGSSRDDGRAAGGGRGADLLRAAVRLAPRGRVGAHERGRSRSWRGSATTRATVWSFADNARANAFYEHQGFERDGGERREDAWAGILEVRYRRPTI